MDIVWYLILGLVIGAGIRVVLKMRKKKKESSTKEITRDYFSKMFNKRFEENNNYFAFVFNMILKNMTGQTKEEIDALCDEVPAAKERFALACHNLAKVGSNNLCFMEDEKIKLLDYSQRTNDICKSDTIKALPYLADFYKEYNFLYRDLFEELLLNKMTCGVFRKSFQCLFSEERDEENQEDVKNLMGLIESFFDIEVDKELRRLLELDENFDIRNSKDPLVVECIGVVEAMKEEGLLVKFVQLWTENMREFSKKYAILYNELYEFFKKIEAEVKEDLPMLSFILLKVTNYNLSLREKTPEECLRVLELYNSGVLTGGYYSFQDPKYRT